jgi:hypothetical protein
MVLFPILSWSQDDDMVWRTGLATMRREEQQVLRARHAQVMARLELVVGSQLLQRLLNDGAPLSWLWGHRRVLPWPSVAAATHSTGTAAPVDGGGERVQLRALRTIVPPPPNGMPSAFYGLIAGAVVASAKR